MSSGSSYCLFRVFGASTAPCNFRNLAIPRTVPNLRVHPRGSTPLGSSVQSGDEEQQCGLLIRVIFSCLFSCQKSILSLLLNLFQGVARTFLKTRAGLVLFSPTDVLTCGYYSGRQGWLLALIHAGDSICGECHARIPCLQI